MSRTADVVVVGAGAIGSACAYYLAEAGLKVVLVEREAVASGSSTHPTGFLNLLGGFKTETYLSLGIESYRLTRELVSVLEDLTRVDVQRQIRPMLRLALEESEEDQIRSEMLVEQKMTPVRWISGDDVLQIEPRFTPAVRGAAYQDESQQLSAPRYTLALAMAAERRGAKLLLRRVTGLLRENEHVTGVRYEGGEISSGAVVLAMGCWSPLASSWLGFDVPIRPLKGERILLDFKGRPLDVLVISPKRGGLISGLDGLLSVGSTAGTDSGDKTPYYSNQIAGDGFDVQPTEEALKELLQRCVDLLPEAADAELAKQLAGVRPMSPDLRPLIGPVPGCPGAYLATGHGHKGIHLAAGTGRIIADLITKGHTDLPVSLETFDPARFAGRTAHYEATPRVSED